MIRPNMATMLGFIATDARIAPSLLQTVVLKAPLTPLFNRITIDGDTSTNDSFVLIASRQAGMPRSPCSIAPGGRALQAAVTSLAQELAQPSCVTVKARRKFISITVEAAAPTPNASSPPTRLPTPAGQDRLLCQRP